MSDLKNLEEHVKKLVERAAKANTADEAQKYSQAALNSARVIIDLSANNDKK